MDSLSPSGHGYTVEPPRTGSQAGSSVLGGFLFLVLCRYVSCLWSHVAH